MRLMMRQQLRGLTMVCVIAILLGWCWRVTLAPAAELVPNGGFEEMKARDFLAAIPPKTREFYEGTADSPFQSWAFGGHWDHGDYSIAVSDDVHTGKRACQITCRTKGRGGIAGGPVPLKAGTIVQVSLWVKAKRTPPAGGFS